MPQDDGLELPVMLLWRESQAASKRSAVVLSHDSAQCASEKPLKDFARALAEDGYLVAIPEHATANRASRRAIKNVSSLYGASDTVGLPPIAMRVWDDLATMACLSSRNDVGRIAIVGLGVGGVDAAITTARDDRIAAVGVVGAVTVPNPVIYRILGKPKAPLPTAGRYPNSRIRLGFALVGDGRLELPTSTV